MNLSDIAQFRLTAQHISKDASTKPEDVVGRMLAMQAQDYPGALWSIGLRTQGCTQKDVEKAIAERKIVRTWPMRGTLHFLHATDVHWMVQLLAPRATAAAKSRRIKQLGLTDAVVDEAEKALRSELHGGKAIARNKVVELLSRKVTGLHITNQHTQHLMRNFGERGIICFGPHAGKQPTFVLLDEWIPKLKPKDRDEALSELAKRYVTSHGPAQLTDLAGWAGLTMADARRALELARAELETIVVSGTTYYVAASLAPAKGPSAYLLPGFDEYMLGYKDRSAALAFEHSSKIVPGSNGMFLATIVVDGQVVGTWKRQARSKEVIISLNPFMPLSKTALISLKRAAEHYGAFIGLTGRLA